VLALAVDAGMKDLTLQSATKLFQAYKAFFALVGMADCRMEWTRSARPTLRSTKDDTVTSYLDYVRCAKALAAAGTVRPVLGRIFAAVCHGERIGRLERLERVSRKLVGRIALNGGGPGRGRYLVKRWILVNAPEEVFMRWAPRTNRADWAAAGRPRGEQNHRGATIH
jgi:hypothetical protein